MKSSQPGSRSETHWTRAVSRGFDCFRVFEGTIDSVIFQICVDLYAMKHLNLWTCCFCTVDTCHDVLLRPPAEPDTSSKVWWIGGYHWQQRGSCMGGTTRHKIRWDVDVCGLMCMYLHVLLMGVLRQYIKIYLYSIIYIYICIILYIIIYHILYKSKVIVGSWTSLKASESTPCSETDAQSGHGGHGRVTSVRATQWLRRKKQPFQLCKLNQY